MVGPSGNGDEMDRDGSDKNPTRFQLQYEAIVASQESIGEVSPSTSGDVLTLALGPLEV